MGFAPYTVFHFTCNEITYNFSEISVRRQKCFSPEYAAQASGIDALSFIV